MSRSTVTVADLVRVLSGNAVRPMEMPPIDTRWPVHLEIVVDGKRGEQPCFDILIGHDKILLVSKDAAKAGSLDFLPEYGTDGKDAGPLQ